MGLIQFRPANCKSCYKCIRHCAVKAIAFKNGQARVLDNECILCGRCTIVCPQNAKQIKSDLPLVKQALEEKQKMIVSLAPSYAAAYPGVSFAVLSGALKRLGFMKVEETAIGATEVTAEYERLMRAGKKKNLISTCCPAIVSLVEKHYPDLVQYLAPVASPASVHARMARIMYGDRTRVVFIGPCFAKHSEVSPQKDLFAALTFQELNAWLEEENILLDEPDEEATEIQQTKSRIYPISGGVIATLGPEVRKKYRCLSIDGLERCMQTLDAMQAHEQIAGYFLEMSACTGSCLGGPGMNPGCLPSVLAREEMLACARHRTRAAQPLTEHIKVDTTTVYRKRAVEAEQPSEEQIQEILHQLGKYSEKDCLNCGTCGYSTCREKAIAVFQGKANLFMCLPYLRERAESMSNEILAYTPNAILLVDRDETVLEANRAAGRLFENAQQLKGAKIEQLLEKEPFERAKQGQAPVLDCASETADGQHIVEQSVVPLPNGDSIVLVKDITQEEQKKRELEQLREETMETAQRVIDKQMRVAQEIASLLGETTGETKVALTKLKKSFAGENKA